MLLLILLLIVTEDKHFYYIFEKIFLTHGECNSVYHY